MKRIYLAYIIVAGLVGCKIEADKSVNGDPMPTDPSIKTSEVSYTRVDKGILSSIQSQRIQVVRNDYEYNALWSEHTKGLQPVSDKPAVDFSKVMLVAIFLGLSPMDSCFDSFDITGIEDNGNGLKVKVSI